MAIRKDITIAFPINTNLDNFVFHYAALFNAHGVKHNLPHCVTPHDRLTNALQESQNRLLHDFKTVNAQLYDFKNTYGDVEVAEMKVTGNSVRISYILGK